MKLGHLVLATLKELNSKKIDDKEVYWCLYNIMDELGKDSFGHNSVEVCYEDIMGEYPTIEGTYKEQLVSQKVYASRLKRVSDIINKKYGFTSRVSARHDPKPCDGEGWVETPWLSVTFKFKKVNNHE